MEAWLQHLITQSLAWSLTAVLLVTFLESLALVGLLLPGTVMMVSLGALIGSGNMGFYPAWGVGIIGCLLGDWISYFIGWRFRDRLHGWSFLQKHSAYLYRTEKMLHQHHMATVLIGRFVGPTRPLIPMVAGMLELPPRRFAVPNIIGCITWPPAYLMPGILAGVALDIPKQADSNGFKWLLLATALLVWGAVWLLWQVWRQRSGTAARPDGWLTPDRLRWMAPLTVLLAGISLWQLWLHPLMPVYRRLLWQILNG
ncbi:DedA family protein [Musicola paradisiaca]|uniref:SNARE associated Golgi protein n=1 Tax=Musicola paradisiaca (strain Ech703) TaxID=579405 RepID=C6C9H5_MUSP7|nr:DedA family protein [Musicola paradisiaca]ACS84426.1 SNARE associated Golgi protein [Musicola paradisiaca Ech703]